MGRPKKVVTDDKSVTELKINAIPNIREFTIKELRKVEVPTFQRWIVEKNKVQLGQSILDVGMLRCPVIFFIKSKKAYQIIDGNHMREIITDKTNPNYKDADKISCIYQEVETETESANAFKMLNTKGKQLDWVDITNLYMFTKDGDNVYKDIWILLGNPKNLNEVRPPKGFSVPTIVEVIAGDKGKYRNGNGEFEQPRQPRKQLLSYLMAYANDHWNRSIGIDGARPNGASIIGFANYWFREQHHKNFGEADFLDLITEIFVQKSSQLESGELVINRENAGKLLHKLMQQKFQPENV